jgi:hypothetical protein
MYKSSVIDIETLRQDRLHFREYRRAAPDGQHRQHPKGHRELK